VICPYDSRAVFHYIHLCCYLNRDCTQIFPLEQNFENCLADRHFVLGYIDIVYVDRYLRESCKMSTDQCRKRKCEEKNMSTWKTGGNFKKITKLNCHQILCMID
jgi:hypothetical protein